MQFSIYKNTKDKFGVKVSLDAVVARIRSGGKGLEEKTEVCHSLSQTNPKQYREYKASELPAVTFAGIFFTRDKVIPLADKMESHSSRVILDFDDVDVPSMMAEVVQMPSTELAFISPSGSGLKVVVPVNPTPAIDAHAHKAAWAAAVEAYSHIGDADRLGSDPTRLCFLAYDVHVYHNPNATSIAWELSTETESETKENDKVASYTVDCDTKALSFISPEEYDRWLAVGMACHAAGLPLEVWDNWSKGSKKYEVGVCAEKWQTFSAGHAKPVTWGTVVKWATESGYKKKRSSTKAERTDNPFYNGKKFLPMAMESYLTNKGNRYLSLSEEHGLRVYKDGIYIREREIAKQDRLLRAVQEALGGELFKMSHYNEVRSMLLDSVTPLSECDNTTHLCVANGILNLETLELTQHTPERVFLSRLPVEYNPEATCPQIEEWLRDVLENDIQQVDLFLEAIGYTLLQTTELQKLFILEGPTKTGKSTAGKLLRALLGEGNVSNISLHAIDDEENRFQRVRLLGKVANISSDISAKRLKGDGYVKAVVSGDPIEAESKGVDSFTFTPCATLWAMANRMPGSYDKTSGWYERLLIIPFKKQFLPGSANPPDTQILKNLTIPAELSGLLTLALQAGKIALKRGAFATTEKQREAVELVKEQNDAVYAFVQSLDTMITNWEDGEFYNTYTKWVAQEDREAKPLSKTKLADACKVHDIVRAKRGSRDNRVWVWERKNEYNLK